MTDLNPPIDSHTEAALNKQDPVNAFEQVAKPTKIVCGLPQTEISHAISFARITLIVGLVFLHYEKFPNMSASAFDGLDINNHVFATWFISAILFFFFSVVPLLSMVSGWLFFSFKPDDAWPSIARRAKRRFVSLYLPLVAWNAFFVLCLYAFYLSHPNSPFLENFEFTFPFTHKMDYINSVFGLTHRPIGFQFWFVRDLFVTALISPILWLSIRYVPWLGLAILGVGWLAHSHMLIFCRPDVPFFFYIGALIRQKNFNIAIPKNLALALVITYVALSGLRALAPLVVDVPSKNVAIHIATDLMRLIGVTGCWGVMYRMAQSDWGRWVGRYGGLAFFLHSAHWPLLVIVKLWLWPLMLGDSDVWMLVHYFITVAITTVIGVGLGNLLAKKTPRFFSLMNGGRLLGETGH